METAGIAECERCRRRMASLYLLRSEGGSDAVRCIRCTFMHWPTLNRSLRIAALVGSALLAINQGDTFLTGELDAALLWKAPLTFATPFVVSIWGALANARVGRSLPGNL